MCANFMLLIKIRRRFDRTKIVCPFCMFFFPLWLLNSFGILGGIEQLTTKWRENGVNVAAIWIVQGHAGISPNVCAQLVSLE